MGKLERTLWPTQYMLTFSVLSFLSTETTSEPLWMSFCQHLSWPALLFFLFLLLLPPLKLPLAEWQVSSWSDRRSGLLGTISSYRNLGFSTSSSWIFPAHAIVRCLSSPLSWEHAQNPPVLIPVLKVLFRPAVPNLFGTRDRFQRRACFHVLAIHWKDSCWSSNTLATWCEELPHCKRPWCWEILKVGGEGDDRGWDGWIASSTQWKWVWASSGSWWWTGKPGVLQSMGSQRVDTTEWLNWKIKFS